MDLKRAFDLTVIGTTAIVTVPAMLVLAVLVRFRIGRPILFRQVRAGRHGRPFIIYKFRTMSDAVDDEGRLLPPEQRMTHFGRMLRRYSLDELPQLANIFRGDMSIVGPRPLYIEYLNYYSPREARRHEVRPGITGLAQVSGRNNLTWDDRLETDVRYVENLRITQDLSIIWRTMRRALLSSDVVVVARDSGEPLDLHRSYPRAHGLSLRGIARADLPIRVAWMSDGRVRAHMQLPERPNLSDTLAWYQRVRDDRSRDDLVLYDLDTKEVLAMIGVKAGDDPHELPVLYMFVAPQRQGGGLGGQALTLLYRWLAETRRYSGTRLTVDRRNVRAIRLYQRMGYIIHKTDDPERLLMSLSVGEWVQRSD